MIGGKGRRPTCGKINKEDYLNDVGRYKMQQKSKMQAHLRLPGGIREGFPEEVTFRLRLEG